MNIRVKINQIWIFGYASPLSLETEMNKGLISVIIKRNIPIPFEAKKDYVTSIDN